MDLQTNITELGFSKRSINALHRLGIYTIEDLTNLKVEDIKNVRNIGTNTGKQMIEKIHQLGFFFEDEKWKDTTLSKDVFKIKIEEIGLSKKAVTFLKQNGIHNIFDFVQIEENFLSFSSLSGYTNVCSTVKKEILEKRKEANFIKLSLYKEKIEAEIGPLSILGSSIISILPREICNIINEASMVRTIRELLQLTNDFTSFQRFRGEKGEYISKEMYEEIVKIVHEKGLLFADERFRTRLRNECTKEEILALSLEEIMLPKRDIHILKGSGIHTVKEVCNLSLKPFSTLTTKSIYFLRRMGENTQIVEKIHQLGVTFKEEPSRKGIQEETEVLEIEVQMKKEAVEVGKKLYREKKEKENQEILLKKEAGKKLLQERKEKEELESLLKRRAELKEENEKLDREIEKLLPILYQVYEMGKTYGKR